MEKVRRLPIQHEGAKLAIILTSKSKNLIYMGNKANDTPRIINQRTDGM